MTNEDPDTARDVEKADEVIAAAEESQLKAERDPQTAIDHDLYPSSARPSGLEVPQVRDSQLKAEREKQLIELAHYLEAIGQNSVHYVGEIEMFKRAARELRYMATSFTIKSPAELKIAELKRQVTAMRFALVFLRDEIDYESNEESRRANLAISHALEPTAVHDYFKVCPNCGYEVAKWHQEQDEHDAMIRRSENKMTPPPPQAKTK